MKDNILIIGSGIGGLSAAALLAKKGYSVTILEAAHVPGGCASSYHIKRPNGLRFTFEAGATTIVGLDTHQPLWLLEKELGIRFPVEEISPSMTIHFSDKTITRHKDRHAWISESEAKFFGESSSSLKVNHRAFWHLVFELSDFVWRVAERNRAFPPRYLRDFVSLLLANSLADFPKLRFLFRSTREVLHDYSLDQSQDFIRFCDEQLMITAQATTEKVPFLYATPCLSYTNASNYYAKGGVIAIANTLLNVIEENGGKIYYRHHVHQVKKRTNGYLIECTNGAQFEARQIVSNATLWNMAQISEEPMQSVIKRHAKEIQFGWGALTMSIAVNDSLAEAITLHHQVHLDTPLPHCGSQSFFISLSQHDDEMRHPLGYRAIAISTHTRPEVWFTDKPTYDRMKSEVETTILGHLERVLKGFRQDKIVFKTVSTPKSWEEWTYRFRGRVGGVPNTLDRNVFDLFGSDIGIKGMYFVGDTVYPGQGIAGVALSGFNAVYRLENERG